MTRRRLTYFTHVNVMIAVALLALVVVAFVPKLRVSFIVAREDAISRDLDDLGDRLEKNLASRPDRDADGAPEFPTLSAALASPAFATRAAQFTAVAGHPEVFERYGYYFAMYLADRNRRPVPAADPSVSPDYAELTYLLIAWPVDPGSTGQRAYLRTPTDGLLRHGIDGYPYGGPDGPPVPRVDLVVLRNGRPVAASVRDLRTQRWISPR